MGCDIHSYVEFKHGEHWDNLDFSPFRTRSYGAFAFLAGVRNYSGVRPISEPRGLPADLAFITKHAHDEWKDDAHTASWLSVRELLDFDYEAMMEDRRYTRREAAGFYNGGATCEPGQGKQMTWREFLGDWFMRDLEILRTASKTHPDMRIVFWFDN